MKKIIFLSIFAALLPNLAYGATIYVDGNLSSDCTPGHYSVANRNCSGSDGNAYKTVNGAIDAASSGDTIYIRSGTYEETTFRGDPGDNNEVCFYIDKALTLAGYQSENPILRWENYSLGASGDPPLWSSGALSPVIRIAANNVTLKDFTVYGTQTYGDCPLDQDGDVTIYPESYGNITLQNLVIRESGHAAFKANAQNGGLTVEYCDIRDTGFDSRDHHFYFGGPETANEVIIRYNYMYDNTGYGLHLYDDDGLGTPTFKVYGNIITGDGAGFGILVQTDTSYFYNNVVHNFTTGVRLRHNHCHDNVFKNNVFYGNTTDMDSDWPGGDPANAPYDNTGEKNIIETNSTGSGEYSSTTDITSNPNFVVSTPDGTDWTDYRLSSSSPAINVGVNLGASYDDALDPTDTTWPPSTLDQTWFPTGWEIGAFVFKDRPAPPQNLRIK